MHSSNNGAVNKDMKKYMRTLCVLLIANFLFGCSDKPMEMQVGFRTIDGDPVGSESLSLLEQYEALKSANATQDARSAFKSGDRRWAGVVGIALTVPGVEHELADSEIKVVQWSTDSFVDELHLEVDDLANDYATAYNAELMRLVSGAEDELNGSEKGSNAHDKD
jgi:hypothetical protein